MVVGYVPMIHSCSSMGTNHTDMIAHTPALLRVGEYSCQPDFQHASRGWLAFFFLNFFAETFSRDEIRTRDSTQQASALTINVTL